MTVRRTTVAAEHDDLVVLEHEARRRGTTLTAVLRQAVEREAARLRSNARPRFGIVEGDGRSTQKIAEDEDAPARQRGLTRDP